MDLTKTKLYQSIMDRNVTAEHLWILCNEYVHSKKNINITDNRTGENFLHVLSARGGDLVTPWGVPVIYIIASSGIHMDARDARGDTCLHRAARVNGSYRIIEALLRCGVDPLICNNEGQTAADVLETVKPADWQKSLKWLNKYSPGLYHTVTQDNSEKKVEELLKGWCRTKLCRSDGKEVDLCDVVKMTDRVRTLLKRYGPINEFVIAMLAGKIINDNLPQTVDVDTKDHMHEGTGLRSPQVPKPLLMTLWEARLETSVDKLLSMDVCTTSLYSKSGLASEAEPLFFHLITSKDRSPDSILHKILIKSSMTCRNQQGQTVLFKAIECDFSKQFVQALFKYGVDISARDDKGRTARDYAEHLRKLKYLTVIDEYVIDIVKSCEVEKIQHLVLQGYDHIVDITDNRGINVVKLFKHYHTQDERKPDMMKLIEKIPAVQRHLMLIFRATDTGSTDELRHYVSRKFSAARDKCGRTILHKAILNKKKDMIKYIVQNYRNTLDLQDNLGRSPLHYPYLVTEGVSLVNYLLLNGANSNITDWAGRCPDQYHIESCGKDEYIRLQRALRGFTMDVYLTETNFQQSLLKAVKRDDLQEVEALVIGLNDKGDINRYANILFDCVDTKRQNIAVYLIQQGMRTDIYKQYDNCNVHSSACSTYTCDHTLTSLYTRARQLHCYDVLKAINESSPYKTSLEVDGRPTVTLPSNMDHMSLLGLV